MARQILNPRSAPIVWSTVKEAFDQINSNFTELYSTIGGEITPIDFTGLPSSIIPSENSTYSLGSTSKRWKEIYVSDNGISIGNALLVPENTVIKLPAGSKVGNKLINDPADVGFGTISVSGQDDVVADDLPGVLTLTTGAGISITTNAGDDEITFTNTGVIDINTGAGISVAGGSTRTITNTGVTSTSPGLGIALDASTGPVTITNEGIVGIEAGTGISVGARSAETGRVIITNTAPATGLLIFKDIQVQGQPLLTAQSAADRLEFVQGTGIGLTTGLAGAGLFSRITITNQGVTELNSSGSGINLSASTGNITISFDNRIDIIGSVFADDSSRLVDAENKQFFGDLKGSVFADDSSVMVNAIDNTLHAGSVEATGVFATFITNNGVGPFLISCGSTDETGNAVLINPYGSDTTIQARAETHTFYTGAYSPGDELSYPYVQFKTAGAFKTNNGAYFEGDLTGTVNGDVSGSVFSDGSTMLVDGVDGKIVGPVESPSVYGTTYIQTAVYADASAISTAITAPIKGMIVFNDDTGKFQGWNGSAWQDFN
jgi:hypothetical protein